MNSIVGSSKSGLPTITENGGGYSNTGSCRIVTDSSGAAVKPLFVPRGYSNGDHAIFVSKIGMHLVYASHDRGGELATVYRIIGIGTKNAPDALVTEEIGGYRDGDSNAPANFESAIEAALGKSHCYHCREPHYIQRDVDHIYV